jgi:CarD family transcriptional regulator
MCYNATMAKLTKPWPQIGDTLVYPGYGVGVVQGMQERTVNEQKRTYCVIAFSEAGNESKVMIPVDNIQGVGLRPLSSKKGVDQAMGYLSSGQPEILLSWKDRFTAHGELLSSGDLMSISRVLKALWLLNTKKPLSFREKKMYQKAILLLASEVGVVLSRPRAEAEVQILERLAKSQIA